MSEEKRSLTKKNEDFVFRFKKIILQNSKLSTEKIEEIIAEIEDELRVAQKSGQTAAQLFGTPTQAAQKYLDPKQTAKRMHEFKFWTLALDTTLVIFMLFAVVFGFTLFFSKNGNNQAGGGIESLILIALLGGTIYTGVMLKVTPNPKAAQKQEAKWIRWAYLLGAVVAWIVGFTVLGLLPQSLNPTLPPVVYLALAILAFVAFRWNRQRFGLKGGFFAISQLAQQARLDEARNKK